MCKEKEEAFMKDRMTYVIVSSFIKGIGSILDNGSLYEKKSIKNMNLNNDVENIRKDWITVGKDLNKVIGKYGDSFKRKTI